MNQFIKNKVMKQQQIPLIEANESILSFMKDEEVTAFIDNLVRRASKFTNDPFVLGVFNNDGTMTMEDVKISGEEKAVGPVFEIEYINSGKTVEYNKYSLRNVINKMLVTRNVNESGHLFPKDQRQLVSQFKFGGHLSDNHQVTFKLQDLNDKICPEDPAKAEKSAQRDVASAFGM